jgi:plastocyanin
MVPKEVSMALRRLLWWATVTAAGVVLGVGAAASQQSGTVTGKITAKGLRTSGDIVVSLEAPDLKVVPPKEPVVLDQKQMEFIPHVLAVVTGTTVSFLNSDSVAHNVFSPDGKYNLGTWPTGQSKDHIFDKPGVYTQLCQVHPEMEGYVVVLDTPYYATTDATGQFAIKSVPAGKYKLVAWSEKLKKGEQDITVEAGKPATVDLTLTK